MDSTGEHLKWLKQTNEKHAKKKRLYDWHKELYRLEDLYDEAHSKIHKDSYGEQILAVKRIICRIWRKNRTKPIGDTE